MSSVRKELPADGLYLGSFKAKSLNHLLELDETAQMQIEDYYFSILTPFFILNISRRLFIFFTHALIFYYLLIGLHK